MKLIIEIELGNEVEFNSHLMQTGKDVKRCLTHSRMVAGEEEPYRVGECGKLYDINGNQVGEWRVRDKLPTE